MLDQVVTSCCGDDLLVVNFRQACDLSDRGPAACELVRANPVWDIIFTQKLGQEGLCGVGILVLLKQDFEHETVLVHRPPAGRRADAVKRGQPRCSDQDARRFFPRRASVGRHRRSYTPDTVGEFKIPCIRG